MTRSYQDHIRLLENSLDALGNALDGSWRSNT